MFVSGVVKHRRLQSVASRLFGQFMDDLCSELDARGSYMEQPGVKPRYNKRKKLSVQK